MEGLLLRAIVLDIVVVRQSGERGHEVVSMVLEEAHVGGKVIVPERVEGQGVEVEKEDAQEMMLAGAVKEVVEAKDLGVERSAKVMIGIVSVRESHDRVLKALREKKIRILIWQKDGEVSQKRRGKKKRRHSSSDSGYRKSSSPFKGTGSILSPSRSNGDTSPLEIRSSMSESEKERIEVENRRRRIRRTAKLHRLQHGGRQSRSPNEDENEKKAVLAHKLRVQMQKALRKTAEELKEEERMKQEEQLRERRKRDETLYEESLEIRRREREKRHREWRRRRSSSSSD